MMTKLIRDLLLLCALVKTPAKGHAIYLDFFLMSTRGSEVLAFEATCQALCNILCLLAFLIRNATVRAVRETNHSEKTVESSVKETFEIDFEILWLHDMLWRA